MQTEAQRNNLIFIRNKIAKTPEGMFSQVTWERCAVGRFWLAAPEHIRDAWSDAPYGRIQFAAEHWGVQHRYVEMLAYGFGMPQHLSLYSAKKEHVLRFLDSLIATGKASWADVGFQS